MTSRSLVKLGPRMDSTLSRLCLKENAVRYLKPEIILQCYDYYLMSLPSLVKLGPHTPEKAVSSAPPHKIAHKNVLNRQ